MSGFNEEPFMVIGFLLVEMDFLVMADSKARAVRATQKVVEAGGVCAT